MQYKRMITLVISSSFVAAFLIAPMTASGTESDVLPSLTSYRCRLISQRDRYLQWESNQNRCLCEDDHMISMIDQYLSTKPRDWQEFMSMRSNRTSCVDKHHSCLSQISSALVEIDEELRNVEDDIKYYANLKR